jgi:hypothetical protein
MTYGFARILPVTEEIFFKDFTGLKTKSLQTVSVSG